MRIITYILSRGELPKLNRISMCHKYEKQRNLTVPVRVSMKNIMLRGNEKLKEILFYKRQKRVDTCILQINKKK